MKTKEELAAMSHEELETLVLTLEKNLEKEKNDSKMFFSWYEKARKSLKLTRDGIKSVIALSEIE